MSIGIEELDFELALPATDKLHPDLRVAEVYMYAKAEGQGKGGTVVVRSANVWTKTTADTARTEFVDVYRQP